MSTAKTASRKAITLEMKIGDLLKEYPELLEVLIAQSPHFTRLRNPVLRRVHGGLVTVSHAAAVAGIEPTSLLRTLNTAVGQDQPTDAPVVLPSSTAGSAEPEWVTSAPLAVRLDVREDQRSHADPFARIMDAIAVVPEGQVMVLRNTFEPYPLYAVLEKKGFASWARKLAPEDWEIYFFRAPLSQRETVSQGDVPGNGRSFENTGEIDAEAPTASISIDVRELAPPQPMIKILDALASLKPSEILLVHHQRRPAYLYPKLADLGYRHKTVERGLNQVDIYIRKG